MEDWEWWDLLTSSLAVSDLARRGEAFAFLVIQGLVTGEAGELEKFNAIADEVQAEGEITGWSQAKRVAVALRKAVRIFPNGGLRDPRGELAKSRHQIIEMWQDGAKRDSSLRSE